MGILKTDLKKPFWESKIMIASLLNFSMAMVTIFSGYMLPEEVLISLPDQVTNAIGQRQSWAIASAVFSIIIMISRNVFKGGEQVEKYWQSGAFWGAIFAFLANLIGFWTGIPIPESLTAQLVAAITEYATTGDILTLIGEIVSVAIVIFRLFKTEKVIEPVAMSVASLSTPMSKAA